MRHGKRIVARVERSAVLEAAAALRLPIEPDEIDEVAVRLESILAELAMLAEDP